MPMGLVLKLYIMYAKCCTIVAILAASVFTGHDI